jgi:hypothetical protein
MGKNDSSKLPHQALGRRCSSRRPGEGRWSPSEAVPSGRKLVWIGHKHVQGESMGGNSIVCQGIFEPDGTGNPGFVKRDAWLMPRGSHHDVFFRVLVVNIETMYYCNGFNFYGRHCCFHCQCPRHCRRCESCLVLARAQLVLASQCSIHVVMGGLDQWVRHGR